MPVKSINLPTEEDRTLIIGPTGSGKTYAGLWLLSMMPVDQMPWIAIDYKGEEKLHGIPYVQYLRIGDIPSEPGVYIVQPLHTQVTEMEDYLMSIWEHTGIGLYIDEGAMLAKSDALDIILIQGRSKHIPVIMLTQRPVDISRYAFSESQFRMLFPNDDRREQKTVSEFMPLFRERNSGDDEIPRFHSYYYEVKERQLDRLAPVPKLETIYATFARKLRPDEPERTETESMSPANIKGIRYVSI